MKRQIKIGDLVYIPSEVTLFNESTTHKLNSPASLLITGEKNNNYEVFFNGEKWLVSQNNVYQMREKNVKTC
jgi:hypothetical protein